MVLGSAAYIFALQGQNVSLHPRNSDDRSHLMTVVICIVFCTGKKNLAGTVCYINNSRYGEYLSRVPAEHGCTSRFVVSQAALRSGRQRHSNGDVGVPESALPFCTKCQHGLSCRHVPSHSRLLRQRVADNAFELRLCSRLAIFPGPFHIRVRRHNR
jgi:hypothetical protein